MPNAREPKWALRPHSPLAGFLSYVVPGLGQIYQGRIGKGLLFLVCLYSLFFYGMALGSWRNVYLSDSARFSNAWGLPTPLANLYNRLQFAGQVWIGAAAWPALWQYNFDTKPEEQTIFGNFERAPTEDQLNKLQREGDKTWDLGWMYTVIAGVLNILVIYDAFAGPALADSEESERPRQEVAAA
jgi:TM2 domain-containing membrane protein YozV